MSDAYRRAGVDTEAAAEGRHADRRPGRARAATRGGRRGRRVRGAVPDRRGTHARRRHRRRRHQARDRAADRAAGHGRHRPGRDVRRRRRVHRRRAAVLPGLPGGRQGHAGARGRRSWKAWPRDAGAPAARCWAARRPSTPASCPTTSSIWRGSASARWTRPRCSGRNACGTATCWWGSPRAGCTRTASRSSAPPCWSATRSIRRRPVWTAPLADELLEPCVIYTPEVLSLANDGLLHAAAHITGGGFVENIPRALPPGSGARIRRGSWPEPAIFELVRGRRGRVGRRHVLHVQHGGGDGAGRRPRATSRRSCAAARTGRSPSARSWPGAGVDVA